MERDLLGGALSETDLEVVQLYRQLKTLAGRTDLPPCAERNVKKALACLWQVVNDLDLEFEQLYDVGV